MKSFLSSILIIFNIFFDSSDVIVTQRSLNYLREGAGSFYKLVSIVPANTQLKVISEKENWLQVEMNNGTKGWISKYSISKVEKKDLKISKPTAPFKDISISKVGMSAAIKGFRGKSIYKNSNSLDKINQLIESHISKEELSEFEWAFAGNESELIAGDSLLQKNNMVYDPSFDEIQIGNQVAARILSNKLYTDATTNKYLNLILTHLVQKNSFFDWDFKIFIIDTTVIDGYACPGGTIFLTLGAVKACLNEAQAAGMIAHEVAHVIERHGIQEILKRKTAIKMDEVFNEINDDSNEAEKELDEYSQKAFEKIVHQRLVNYEIEADNDAVRIIRNAGYNPFSYADLIKKLSLQYDANSDIFSDDYLSPNDMKQRFTQLEKSMKLLAKQTGGPILENRFQKNIK